MADVPPLPPGFTLDATPPASAVVPPLPPGFKLDAAVAPPADAGTASRAAGIGARGAIAGAADLVDLPSNMVGMADRAGVYARNKIRAALGLAPDAQPMAAPPQYAARGATAASNALNLPAPQSPAEQVGFAAARGAAGAVGMGGAAGVNALRAGIAGATGGASSDLARQAGAGPIGQVAAGVVGGGVPAIAEGVTRSAVRAGSNALRPLTAAGQQDIAATTLQTQARNPQAAATNLENAPEIVPGSPRTMGEASKDNGLLALEKGIRGKYTADFADRLSQQNDARQKALQGVAGSEADVSAAQAARTAQTTPMRENALAAGGTADPTPVIKGIESTLAGPIGKRDVASQALTWLKEKLSNADGNPETDPAKLYAVRQDINDAIGGKLGGEQAKFRLASGQLIQARGQLDDAIEAAAPGFKAYLQRYSDLSKPIDQMKVIQEIQKRSQLASTGDTVTGQPFMSSAGFSRALDGALQDGKLTSGQVSQLKAIKTDLQYGQAINGPQVKAPGSDTFQNLSIAQVLGAGPNPASAGLRALSKPLEWLYKAAGSDQRVNDLLKDAALDPKFAAALLRRATPQSTYQLSEALKRMAVSSGLGGAAGIPGQLSGSSAAQTTSGQSP